MRKKIFSEMKTQPKVLQYKKKKLLQLQKAHNEKSIFSSLCQYQHMGTDKDFELEAFYVNRVNITCTVLRMPSTLTDNKGDARFHVLVTFSFDPSTSTCCDTRSDCYHGERQEADLKSTAACKAAATLTDGFQTTCHVYCCSHERQGPATESSQPSLGRGEGPVNSCLWELRLQVISNK